MEVFVQQRINGVALGAIYGLNAIGNLSLSERSVLMTI